MKRLLILAPLTILALAAAAEAQSQAGGLPDVSARVTVLETQNKALETRVTTLQEEAKALFGDVRGHVDREGLSVSRRASPVLY